MFKFVKAFLFLLSACKPAESRLVPVQLLRVDAGNKKASHVRDEKPLQGFGLFMEEDSKA
jgi:hypothetical protein